MTIQLVNISTLYPLVSTDCPGLNENSAIDHLRWAARRFCQETHVSQDEVETSITAGDPILFVQSGNSNLSLHRIFAISVSVQAGQTGSSRQIIVRTPDEMDSNGHAWRERTGEPRYFVPTSPGEVRLVPIPNANETGVIVRASFFPSRTTLKIDQQVADRYAEIIACGALSRILRIGKQPWTDLRESDRLRSEFDTDTNRCRPHGAANQGFTSSRTVIRRQF